MANKKARRIANEVGKKHMNDFAKWSDERKMTLYLLAAHSYMEYTKNRRGV